MGEGTAKALLHHLGAKASDSGGKPFSEGLRRITGGGADAVERLIVKAFYSNLGLNPEGQAERFSFESSIKRARELRAGGRATS